jgi:hypothetical protein
LNFCNSTWQRLLFVIFVALIVIVSVFLLWCLLWISFFCNMYIILNIISFVFSCLHLSLVLLTAFDVIFLIHCMYLACGLFFFPSICRCCCRNWPSGCWVSAWMNGY